MNIDVGIKIHNRFDIKVKDVITGEIVQIGKAENIVLESMYGYLCSSNSATPFNRINFGEGNGVMSVTRTSLFTQLGYKVPIQVDTVHNLPPAPSYDKTKITLLSEEYIGKTITEVGIGNDTTLLTHALIKDSEGNPISIGPKTDTQEITIYATLYAEVILPEWMDLIVSGTDNELLKRITQSGTNYLNTTGSNSMLINLSSSKTPTVKNQSYVSDRDIGTITSPFTNLDIPNKKQGTGRVRFNSGTGNGKIWSINIRRGTATSLLRILFPNALWQGYEFKNKSIGVGNGSTNKFILPWSDINTSKEYKIYVDGVLKTKDVDYTLANSESETSVTFENAPASGLAITGDWWVDYIPKDADHILDVTFTITYGEGS